jgi:hypothetical protein
MKKSSAGKCSSSIRGNNHPLFTFDVNGFENPPSPGQQSQSWPIKERHLTCFAVLSLVLELVVLAVAQISFGVDVRHLLWPRLINHGQEDREVAALFLDDGM